MSALAPLLTEALEAFSEGRRVEAVRLANDLVPTADLFRDLRTSLMVRLLCCLLDQAVGAWPSMQRSAEQLLAWPDVAVPATVRAAAHGLLAQALHHQGRVTDALEAVADGHALLNTGVCSPDERVFAHLCLSQPLASGMLFTPALDLLAAAERVSAGGGVTPWLGLSRPRLALLRAVAEAQQGYLVELIGDEADAARHYVTCAGHALRALRLAPAGTLIAEEAEAMLQVAYQRLRSEPIDVGPLNRLAIRLPLQREGMIARLTLASVQARGGRIGQARFSLEVLRGDAARLGETVVLWVATAWLAQLDEHELGETEATRQWRRLAVYHLRRLWDDRVGRFEALLLRRRLREASATVDRERAQLWQDALTAVGNRRMLDRLLSGENAGDRPTAFIDVDWFKQINDRYGHAVGDEVLRRVAAVLTDVRRRADVVVRYGGDEFVVVLADHGDVAGFANRIRMAVAGHPWHEVAPGLAVSVTVGVAEAGPRALIRAEDSLRAAKAARTTG